MALAAFASPLFAVSESPPNFEKTLKINDGLKNVIVTLPSAADAVKKVNVLHKDTLMYSWESGLDNRHMLSGLKNDGHDETTVSSAMVSQLRGETGV